VRIAACPPEFAGGPAPDEIHAWVVDLQRPPLPLDDLSYRLAADELARAARYRIARARQQFVIGRGLLRGLLGTCLGVPPDQVPLVYLPSGKPVLPGAAQPLHFNITHTDGILVLVVGRRRVGVDVERVRPMADADGLVARYFSAAEAATFRGLSEHDRVAAFFRGWTCKEAVIKAAGATVGCLAEFDVELHPAHAPRVNSIRDPQLAGVSWALTEWVADGNAAVAVAVEGASELVVERNPA
jgi:4'-phosphopantetheinyl transferase